MRAILGTIFLFLSAFSVAASPCTPGQVNLRGDWGQVSFAVDVVDTDETRAKGLMFVETMPRFSGMLFVYNAPRPVKFWMKNTLIPLDMIFMDETGTVTRIHENAIPQDLTPIDGGNNVQVVLEINGGMARTLGITVGSQVQHPAFGNAAVWACTQS
ncbi:MAG: DUF192 domain-containing protein [Alphaproteobacteria bacterium]|nr:DUF192 domain-containing protein [Alphaproteobacteria bacterium]